MALGRDLVDALGGAREREVEVSDGRVRARAHVGGSDRYGAEVRGLSVASESGRAGDVGRQAGEVERRVTYLPDRLRVVEVDAERGEAIVRSAPEEVRDRRYFEVRVRGREIELERYRYLPERTDRERVATPVTHETLERLVDDLASIVDG